MQQMKTKVGKNQALTIFDKLYSVFFLLLPFVYAGKLIDPVLVPRQLYLTCFLLILIFCIANKFYAKKMTIDTSFLKMRFFSFQLLFLLIVLITSTQAILLSESVYVFSKLGVEFVFIVITTYLIIQNQLQITILTKTLALLCFIILLNASLQAILFSKQSTDFFDSMISVRSTFGHKNLLASILFLTLPFSLILIQTGEKWWKRSAFILIAGVLLFAWLLQAKAVLISCFIFFLSTFLILFPGKRMPVQKKSAKRILTTVTLFIIGISIFTFFNKEKFPRLLDKKSSYERLELWRNSLKMIKENPILGVGTGNWQIHFPKYGLNNFGDEKVKQGITTFQRPHNDFLWVLCETGIIGLITYLLIFAIIIYYLIKLIRGGSNSFMYATLLATVIGYMCIAFVDFPIERIEHQLMLGIIFSIVTANFFKEFKTANANKNYERRSKIPILLVLIPIVLSIFSITFRYKGEFYTKRLYYFERTDNWSSMQQEAKMAINTFYKIDPTSAPIEWYRGVALFSMGELDSAGASFEIAYRQHPYNIHVLNNLASYYEKKEDHKRAEQFYQKALTISTEFEEARLNLSAVYYNTRQYEKAFETIDQCSIYSTDQKYQLFLPAILSALVDELKGKNDRIKKRNIEKTELMKLYSLSKKENISFKNYVENLKGSSKN